MKNWPWIVLLAMVGVSAALLVALLVEKVKYTFFSATERHPPSTVLLADHSAIDESADKAPKPATESVAETMPAAVETVVPEILLGNASLERNPLTSNPIWRNSGLGNDALAEWTTEQAATGRHALKISASQPSGQGWPGWLTQLNHQPNNGYRITTKYYTPDGANAWLELTFFDGNKRTLTSYSSGCPRSSVIGRWTPIQLRVEAKRIPRESRFVEIGLRQCLNHSIGRRTTLYFDDISLIRLVENDSQDY